MGREKFNDSTPVQRRPSSAGAHDGQALGQPLAPEAAVSGFEERQALPPPLAPMPTAIPCIAANHRPIDFRKVSELVLTTVSKFRVYFGEVVDMERNFATMELALCNRQDRSIPIRIRRPMPEKKRGRWSGACHRAARPVSLPARNAGAYKRRRENYRRARKPWFGASRSFG